MLRILQFLAPDIKHQYDDNLLFASQEIEHYSPEEMKTGLHVLFR